jgi:regulator of nonsense transcripts 3
MTEVLIQQALSQFGDIVSVTIDPRKGTAIALFKDAQGLQKAREAKRVSVASGTVEIHEFKDRNAAAGSNSNNRGSHRGNRTGGRGGKAGGGGGGGSGAAAATGTTAPANAAGNAAKASS